MPFYMTYIVSFLRMKLSMVKLGLVVQKQFNLQTSATEVRPTEVQWKKEAISDKAGSNLDQCSV
jgi:hypothetical protein